jgi:hypothetical protein
MLEELLQCKSHSLINSGIKEKVRINNINTNKQNTLIINISTSYSKTLTT